MTPIEKLLDDRYSEKIVLCTPGGFVGHSKYDTSTTKRYPIKPNDFAATFEALASSPAGIEASRFVDVCGLMSTNGIDHIIEQADAEQAYTQATLDT